MSHDGMEALAFAEPSSVSTRQFITQQYTVFPPEGQDYFYKPNETTRIEVSGASQNSFILPRSMRLIYHAVSTISTDGAAPTSAQGVDLWGPMDLRLFPGVPFLGAPHIGSINAEIPGLSSQMSALTSDGHSQRWYAQRLLCSGDEGHLVCPSLKASWGGQGRHAAAGAKDLITRASAVTGGFWGYDDQTMSAYAGTVFGDFQRYEVPAAAWLDLADGASSVLPLPYLTSSSSNLLVRVNWAPVGSALVGQFKKRTADFINYIVSGVSLEWTAVNVVDSTILASIMRLFQGQVSVPIMEGVSVPVPMTLSHRAFRFASTTLNSNAGFVSLRVPAGKAACNAVLLKIDANSITWPMQDVGNYNAGAHTADRHFLSPKAIIQNLVLRVGTVRFPAREISDIYVPRGNVPRGLTNKAWNLLNVDPNNVLNLNYDGATLIPTADSRAAEMYKEARQFFSFFDNDKWDASPADALFDPDAGIASLGKRLSHSAYYDFGQPANNGLISKFSNHGLTQSAAYKGATGASPNLYLFNLQSLLPEDSMRERGYQITGTDLRNTSDIILEFSVLGNSPSSNNRLTGDAVVNSWDISAALEYTELATILPSRCDLEASASLLPSAAGSVASGGVGSL